MSAPNEGPHDTIEALRQRIAACTLCAVHLPLGPRPVTRDLPHPAWRSRLFMARHPWFAADFLPQLRERVRHRLR